MIANNRSINLENKAPLPRMAQKIGNIDATPSKRIFLPIINDYTLNTAICELIDNSIDAWRFNPTGEQLKIIINIDTDQQSMVIEYNACGVPEDDLKKTHKSRHNDAGC